MMAQAPASGCTERRLLDNIVLFGRLLRYLGIEVTPSQISGILTAADLGLLTRREDFQGACRAILVNRREHAALFDLAFELFWVKYRDQSLDAMRLGEILRQVREQVVEREVVTLADGADAETASGAAAQEEETVFTYSDRAVSQHKDFSQMDRSELDQVKRIIEGFHWDFQRRTRRLRIQSRGRRIDLRKSLRGNVKYGGEPLQRAWKSPRQRPRPLVSLCDISGSMERYSRILLQFVYVLSNRMERSEAFVFSTDLSRITGQLQFRSVDEALQRAGREVHDWGGGTRIGESLRQFNFDWARRVLGQGAVVLVISDGWDRGDIPLLEREMSRLQRSCHHLIWLNPLLGSPRYEPLTKGIKAVLPYVDDFRSIHNLVSLQQLGELIENLA